jgi:hypothetical protein
MEFLVHKNNAASTISNVGGITNSATSVSIQSGDVSLFPASGNFEVTLWPAGTNLTFANSEIVLVTGGQGTNTFTITRAQEGTTAKSFNQGDNVGLLVTAKQLTDIEALLSGQAQGSIGYYNSNGQLTALAPGTSGQVLETQGASANPTWVNPTSGGGSTGWTSDLNVWTYASAQTFTVPTNLTTLYTKGTRLQWTDSGGVKYGVVIASSFTNPNTTVTIATNNDYSIANSAISSTFYSYQVNPQGYPTWFNYTPTATTSGGGFSNPPTFSMAKFKCEGSSMTIEVIMQYASSPGGSGTTIISFPANINPTNDLSSGWGLDVSDPWALTVEARTSTGFNVRKYDGTSIIVSNVVISIGTVIPF